MPPPGNLRCSVELPAPTEYATKPTLTRTVRLRRLCEDGYGRPLHTQCAITRVNLCHQLLTTHAVYDARLPRNMYSFSHARQVTEGKATCNFSPAIGRVLGGAGPPYRKAADDAPGIVERNSTGPSWVHRIPDSPKRKNRGSCSVHGGNDDTYRQCRPHILQAAGSAVLGPRKDDTGRVEAGSGAFGQVYRPYVSCLDRHMSCDSKLSCILPAH